MKKLIIRLKLKALLKILFAVSIEVLVIYMVSTDLSDELFMAIVIGVLWSIVFLIYFISGICNLKNGTKYLKEYTKNSKYSMEDLDEEFQEANKCSELYIGSIHCFALASNGIHVIPIKDIEKVFYLHLGENIAKARTGYYYLYLKGEKIENSVRIYFISKTKVEEAIEYLKKLNSNIVVE